MTVTILDLPPEILVLIFKNINLTEVAENCSKTCLLWKTIIAQFVLQPRLREIAKYDDDVKEILTNANWTQQSTNHDLIMSLYDKFKSYKGLYFKN